MRHDVVDGFLFAVFEEADVLLGELCHQLGEEVEGIGLVLSICIGAADDIDYAANDIGLGQGLEEL